MKKTSPIILVTFLLAFSCARGGGTTTGNPIRISMEFSAFNNSLVKRISDFLISPAYASLSSLKMCFKRVRFKAEISSIGKDIELDLGNVEIKQEGTPLSNIEVGSTLYKRIEFDLSKDCDGNSTSSVEIVNSNGTFLSDDSITIRFEGEFDPSNGDLTLFIQNIVDKVKDYQISDGSIKDQLESVSGTY